MGNYLEKNSSNEFINDYALLSWFKNENEQISAK